jgi:hypothetical protein
MRSFLDACTWPQAICRRPAGLAPNGRRLAVRVKPAPKWWISHMAQKGGIPMRHPDARNDAATILG